MSKNTFIAEVTFKKQYKSADPLYKNLKNNQVSGPSPIKQLLVYVPTWTK